MRARPRAFDPEWSSRYRKPKNWHYAKKHMRDDMLKQQREQTRNERLFFGLMRLQEIMTAEKMNALLKRVYSADSIEALLIPVPLWSKIRKPARVVAP